mmetsp:Transcript_21629/g.67522  ORF Transcript_21629/g.67522 Transcript_21629/m.67522 type:complete len:197 (+) Transcript_21629:2-592(+)
MVQLTTTSVSCWAFTYASEAFRMPASLAAMIPGSFYAASTVARLFIAPATVKFRPSAIMHLGVLVTLVAAVAFYALDGHVAALLAGGADASRAVAFAPLLVACFMAMGAGGSPHFSLMLAAMQEHGDLAPQHHGWYGTSTCLGITMGMWLPGVIRLPVVELAGATCLFLMINSCSRDFPRLARVEQNVCAVKSSEP